MTQMRENRLIQNDCPPNISKKQSMSKQISSKIMSKDSLMPNNPIFASSSSHPNIFSLLDTNALMQNSKRITSKLSKNEKVMRSNSNSNIAFPRRTTVIRMNFKEIANFKFLSGKKNDPFFQMGSSRKTKTVIADRPTAEKLISKGPVSKLPFARSKSNQTLPKKNKFLLNQKQSFVLGFKHSSTSSKTKIGITGDPAKLAFSKSLKKLRNLKSCLKEMNVISSNGSNEPETSYVSQTLLLAVEQFKKKFALFFNDRKK